MRKHVKPLNFTFSELQHFPAVTLEAFHECYGSPLTPPVKALWRVGNVRWTGVRLRELLAAAGLKSSARFVWSEGLDHGTFAGVTADRYQKDLPLEKALAPEVLIAFAINGEPLRKERGGPVRLVVPGWYGTNMTKWLCRLSVQDRRAPSPFTTRWYNEAAPADPFGEDAAICMAGGDELADRFALARQCCPGGRLPRFRLGLE